MLTFFFFSSRRRHTRCALVTGVQTCALPISSDLLGTVFFHVDPGADIARIRKKVEESAASNPRWDKRVALLHVTEHRPEALDLRALLSSSNARLDFDLPCHAREAVITFFRDDMPYPLPPGLHPVAGNAAG